VFEVESDTAIKLHSNIADTPGLFLPIPDTNELIWFSERSGWGHLYLIDLANGAIRHPITSGKWLVRDILHFDSKTRELFIQTAGRDPEVNPYYRDVCSVNIDSGKLRSVIDGPYEHIVMQPGGVTAINNDESRTQWPSGVSPCGKYIVVTRSRVNTLPESLLLDRSGRVLISLVTAEMPGLPTDWVWPQPERLVAADGETEIDAVVFYPPSFSESKRYPVIHYSNSLIESSTVPHAAFACGMFNGAYFWAAASFAALGFIVVMVEGRGVALRNKAFQDHSYGNFERQSDVEDRIAAIKQLAAKYSYMDIERVGLTGEENPSNNGYAALKHSDFFKVSVLNCHADPRLIPAILVEHHFDVDDPESMSKQAYPEDYAALFSGKLLMIVGMHSPVGVPSTFRLVEALRAENKDFELLCEPNVPHSITNYSIRREWDFFVRHLMGSEPPKGFKLETGGVHDNIAVKVSKDNPLEEGVDVNAIPA